MGAEVGELRAAPQTGIRWTIIHIAARRIAVMGVRTALDSWPRGEVVAEVPRGLDALHAVRRHQPCLVVISADGVPKEMLVFLQQIRKQSANSRIVLLTDDDRHDTLLAVRKIPVEGFLLWQDMTADGLLAALESTAQGMYVGSRRPVEELVAPEKRRRRAGLSEPSSYEEEVLLGLDRGLTGARLAALVSLSPRTVQRVTASLQQKLGVSSPFQLGERAHELGLIQQIRARRSSSS